MFLLFLAFSIFISCYGAEERPVSEASPMEVDENIDEKELLEYGCSARENKAREDRVREYQGLLEKMKPKSSDPSLDQTVDDLLLNQSQSPLWKTGFYNPLAGWTYLHYVAVEGNLKEAEFILRQNIFDVKNLLPSDQIIKQRWTDARSILSLLLNQYGHFFNKISHNNISKVIGAFNYFFQEDRRIVSGMDMLKLKEEWLNKYKKNLDIVSSINMIGVEKMLNLLLRENDEVIDKDSFKEVLAPLLTFNKQVLDANLVKISKDIEKWYCFPAAKRRQLAAVLTPARNGKDTQAKDGVTALCIAALSGEHKVTKYCSLKHSCSPNMGKNSCYYKMVDFLLNVAKCNASICNEDGQSPLHYAVHGGNLDIVKLFVGPNPVSDTVLWNDNYSIIEPLLKSKISLEDESGLTPLFFIHLNNNYRIVKSLLENGAYLNILVQGKNVPLYECKESDKEKGMLPSFLKGLKNINYYSAIKFLSKKDTSLDTFLNEKTFLNACSLLEKGASLNIATPCGEVLLCDNATYGEKSRFYDVIGLTPLFFDQMEKNYCKIDALLKDVDLKCTPEFFVRLVNSYSTIKFLVQPVLGDPSILNFFLRINLRDERGLTPLFHALLNNSYSIAEFLLKNGAFLNVVTTEGETPLHYAANYGDKKLVELIFEKNPTFINVEDENKRTPLSLAVIRDDYDMAKFLIEKGADSTLIDLYGNSLLDFIYRSHRMEAPEDVEMIDFFKEAEMADLLKEIVERERVDIRKAFHYFLKKLN